MSSTKEVEQPFFSPNPGINRNPVSSSFSGGHNFANIPIFSPRSQPVIQTKLTINEPGDKFEQEADAMADRVMRMSTPVSANGDENLLQTKPLNNTTIQRKCAACEGEEKVQIQEEEHLQTKPLMRKAAGGGYTASPQLSSQLNISKGGGDPLPGKTLGFMNQAFGADFSTVRVHTGNQAAEMSQGIQAKAFTHGSDIYFNRGQYSPESSEGKRLLGHELTHVVQQQTSPIFIQLQPQPNYFDPGGVAEQLDIVLHEGLPYKYYMDPKIRNLTFEERRDKNLQLKIEAIINLGNFRHKNAVLTLIRIVENKSYTSPRYFSADDLALLRQWAVIALGKIGTPEAIKKLTDLLSSKKPEERLLAVSGFSEASGMPMPYWQVVPSAQLSTILLTQLRQETDIDVRIHLMNALGNVGSTLSSAEKKWIVNELWLVPVNKKEIINIIKALRKIRHESAAIDLLNLLKATNEESLILEIISALGEIRYVGAVEYLMILFDDPSKLVRERVAEALGRIGGVKAISGLKKRLRGLNRQLKESLRLKGNTVEIKKEIYIIKKVLEALHPKGDYPVIPRRIG